MNWIKLELRKASNLRKEVDEAIRTLEETQREAAEQQAAHAAHGHRGPSGGGAVARADALRASFEQRIDELEEFYLEHDDDERAVLFEKQRLRLRRALQAHPSSATKATTPSATTPSAGGTASAAVPAAGRSGSGRRTDLTPSPQKGAAGQRGGTQQHAHGQHPHQHQQHRGGGGQHMHTPPDQQGQAQGPGGQPQQAWGGGDMSAITPGMMGSPDDVIGAGGPGGDMTGQWNNSGSAGGGPGPQQQRASHGSGGDGGAGGVAASRRSSIESSVSKSGRRKKKPKALYMWEMKEEKSNAGAQTQRTRRTNEYGTFLPTTVNGFYQKSPYLNAPETHVDFQIVLSEDEFRALASRRRASRAELKHSKRFTPQRKSETPYLMSSTPYIDPGRVAENLYRPAQQEKWVADRDFDITATPP